MFDDYIKKYYRPIGRAARNIAAEESITIQLNPMRSEAIDFFYDCLDCMDTGAIVIPAYQQTGEIVNEDRMPCHCQNNKNKCQD